MQRLSYLQSKFYLLDLEEMLPSLLLFRQHLQALTACLDGEETYESSLSCTRKTGLNAVRVVFTGEIPVP